MTRGEKIILVCIVIPITALWTAVRIFDFSHFIPHVAVTRVGGSVGSWRVGEYRECVSDNEKSNEEEPGMMCLGHDQSETQDTLKVRFYGKTYDDRLPGEVAFVWRCKKNGSKDPVITCDKQRIASFDPSEGPK